MPTIKTYHRPNTVEDALRLLARDDVATVVLAGGTQCVAQLGKGGSSAIDREIVDLQALDLGAIAVEEDNLRIGAMATLQDVADHPQVPAVVREAALREGPNALRHAATVGGSIAAAQATSEFVATLLVFEAKVEITDQAGGRHVALADVLNDIRGTLGHGLITEVSIAQSGQGAIARVARTPADAPIVAAVARQTADQRTLLALCGVAATPVLAAPDDVAGAIKPPGDFQGSTEYRVAMSKTLAARVLEKIS